MEPHKEEVYRLDVRKSALTAKNTYDYKKLTYDRNGFLKCTIDEEKEELHISYDIADKIPFADIRKEPETVRLTILLDVLHLMEAGETYKFSLAPENLYYDIQGRVYVMERDVYEPGTKFLEEVFFEAYKALIGYSLQDKYSYEDYLQGGMELLKKDTFLNKVYEKETLWEAAECLKEEYETIKAWKAANCMEVDKKKWKRTQVLLAAFFVLFLGAGIGLSYYLFYKEPYNQAVIEADNAYLEKDYLGTIDALAEISISRMELHQKYMLAVSFVRTESLTDAQKDNILANVSLNGNVKYMEYWIYLGRLQVTEAEDIAMQMSDNQLLLFAYLKEKYLIENDASLSGEEKTAMLSDMEEKIEALASQYQTEE